MHAATEVEGWKKGSHHWNHVHRYPMPWPGFLPSALYLCDNPSFCFLWGLQHSWGFCPAFSKAGEGKVASVRAGESLQRAPQAPACPAPPPSQLFKHCSESSYSLFAGFLLYTSWKSPNSSQIFMTAFTHDTEWWEVKRVTSKPGMLS